jgi:hypothetical protein
MIKKLLSSKITSTASAEFGVVGLKIVDTETFRHVGIILAVISFVIFLICLAFHAKHEVIATTVPAATTKHNRNNRRSRASRTR